MSVAAVIGLLVDPQAATPGTALPSEAFFFEIEIREF